MQYKTCVVAIVLSAVMSIVESPRVAGGQDRPSAVPGGSDIQEAVTEARLSQAYAELLHGATAESLERMKTEPCLGLALQAAWAEVKRSVATMPAASRDFERGEMKRLPPVAVARFIGFVEGRLRLTPPKWWRERLLKARGRLDADTGLLHLLIPHRKKLYSKLGDSSDDSTEFFLRGDVSSVRASGETLEIECEQGRFEVPMKVRGECYVFAEMRGTAQCVVIVHAPVPMATLFCVDLEKREVIWDEKMWCDNAPYVRSGGGFTHISEARLREDLICVFGMCNDVVYIEGFRLADGKPEFRFSTTYGWTMPSDHGDGAYPDKPCR